MSFKGLCLGEGKMRLKKRKNEATYLDMPNLFQKMIHQMTVDIHHITLHQWPAVVVHTGLDNQCVSTKFVVNGPCRM